MDFVSAVNFIEFSHASGTRLCLETMKLVLSQLGEPHQRLKVIHPEFPSTPNDIESKNLLNR